MEVSCIIARTDLSAEQMVAAIRAEEAKLSDDDSVDDEREDHCTYAGTEVEPTRHVESCPRDAVAIVGAARPGA